MIKRYLVPSDFTVADSWRLVEWCRGIGANEFTIDFLSTARTGAANRSEQFDEAVNRLSLGTAMRERMSGQTADDLVRPTERWRLSDESIGALRDALPGGIFEYDPLQDGWFEDPIFYRDGELVLGVLSHEAFAVLRLTPAEADELHAAGFRSYDSLPRIG